MQSDSSSKRRLTDRIAHAVGRGAAALLAIISILTFVAVMMRYVFNAPIPDGFDISRLLLGAAVFWGIAVASYHFDHVQMDLLWTLAGDRVKRILDVIAALVTLTFFTLLAVMFSEKVIGTLRSNEQTFDLRLPVGVFYAIAWAGLAIGLVLLAVRVWQLVCGNRHDMISESGED